MEWVIKKMFNLEESSELYLRTMLERAEKLVNVISLYPFIKSASIEGTNIKVVFNEEVDLEGQDVFDLFIRGGVVKKKTEGKDKLDKEDFIKVEPIGEF